MTSKQRAEEWARSTWGKDALVVRRKNPYLHDDDTYLIGKAEEGFLGPGIRYFGAGASWDDALLDAQARTVSGAYRGWTNSFSA